MRKVLIFGNGIGRALDNDYFSLERALQSAWDDPSVLTEDQKGLIRQCLPQSVIETDPAVAPKSEDELDILQRILAACDEISKQEVGNGPTWLTANGRMFPTAIKSYIHRAACHFHQGPYSLPADFATPLKDFILSTRSHVATLNYDELLYRSFVGSEVFRGYSCMFDGFNGAFDDAKLVRRDPIRQCYYLHLHGSPLFYSTHNGDIHKAGMSSLSSFAGYSSNHLVLTHVKHKTSVIAASPVLMSYWNRLAEACHESEAIVLVGYSGGDIHLNQLIRNYIGEKRLEIVERKKPDYAGNDGILTRQKYWNNLVGVDPVFWWYENILSHTNWNWQKASAVSGN